MTTKFDLNHAKTPWSLNRWQRKGRPVSVLRMTWQFFRMVVRSRKANGKDAPSYLVSSADGLLVGLHGPSPRSESHGLLLAASPDLLDVAQLAAKQECVADSASWERVSLEITGDGSEGIRSALYGWGCGCLPCRAKAVLRKMDLMDDPGPLWSGVFVKRATEFAVATAEKEEK